VTIAAILLTGIASLAAFAGWILPRTALSAAAAALTLAGAALLAALDPEPVTDSVRGLFLVVACVLAVLGGGPMAVAVFSLVDGRAAAASGSLRTAGDVLRGGAWIGALERAAIFVCLAAGWPPGLAVLLALKGLGRYPELRVQEDSGAAERFIIGTLTSALWAVACAGLALA
jgi:hypothetical protein